nr:MAG TPA: hypothetical protein [Caudoviricetes sp.]
MPSLPVDSCFQRNLPSLRCFHSGYKLGCLPSC